MTASIKDWLPGAAHLAEAAAQQPLIVELNQSLWIFSLIETLHLVAMAALGGAVLVLNLRLLGAILSDSTPQQVERATRPFFVAGVVGTIATGFVMMLATTVSTLPSTAFAVKMVSLVSATALSVVVSRQARRGEDAMRYPAILAALTATAFWLLALGLFASTRNLGAGSLLVASLGFLLLAVLLPGRRRRYVAVSSIILILGLGGTFLLPASEQGDAMVVLLSLATIGTAAAWALFSILREKAPATRRLFPLTQLMAFASTLSWVTVAAAGRWIGFS